MTSQAIVSYFWLSQTLSTSTQDMSVSHGYSTMGGVEYDGGGYVEKTKKEKVTHRRGYSTGYGDALQLMSMWGVGIAMQRMH